MDIRNNLRRLVTIARTAKKNDDALMALGYESTPYWEIYGQAIDVIYDLLGEKTELLSESVTYNAINGEGMSDFECIETLLTEYMKKHGGECT